MVFGQTENGLLLTPTANKSTRVRDVRGGLEVSRQEETETE